MHTLTGAGADAGPGARSNPQCPVCLEDMLCDGGDAGDDVHAIPCGHLMHKACLQQWRVAGGTSCPLCRAAIGFIVLDKPYLYGMNNGACLGRSALSARNTVANWEKWGLREKLLSTPTRLCMGVDPELRVVDIHFDKHGRGDYARVPFSLVGGCAIVGDSFVMHFLRKCKSAPEPDAGSADATTNHACRLVVLCSSQDEADRLYTCMASLIHHPAASI